MEATNAKSTDFFYFYPDFAVWKVYLPYALAVALVLLAVYFVRQSAVIPRLGRVKFLSELLGITPLFGSVEGSPPPAINFRIVS